MNEFWRRLIEMERRQDRASHMMTRASDQINQMTVDNYKGGIFGPIQNVAKLQSGYNVIGTYPFGFDGLWLQVQYEPPAPALNNGVNDAILRIIDYPKIEDWMGWDGYNTSDGIFGKSYPSGTPFTRSPFWGEYLSWPRLDQSRYVVTKAKFEYDWKRGQLHVIGNIYVEAPFFLSIPVFGWRTYAATDYADGGYTPGIGSFLFTKLQTLEITCDYWMDFDPKNPPLSSQFAGSFTVPGQMVGSYLKPGNFPEAMINEYSPDDHDHRYPRPRNDIPEQWRDKPAGIIPADARFDFINFTGTSTWTFRWDTLSEACLDGDPTTECIYKHWDEYDK